MRKRLFILATSALPFLLPASVPAQDPSTQPAQPDERRPFRQFGPDGRPYGDRAFGERRGFGGGGRFRQISEEEWQEASAFMKENFPKRWDVYVMIRDKAGKEQLANDMKYRITNRFRRLMMMQATQPNVYEVAMQQGRAEDDMWGAVRAWQEVADSQDTATREAAQQQLREKVKEVLKKTLDDRKQRLEALQQTIEREQKQLASDFEGMDALVATRVEQLTSDNPFRENPNAPGGPGGPGNHEPEAPR